MQEVAVHFVACGANLRLPTIFYFFVYLALLISSFRKGDQGLI